MSLSQSLTARLPQFREQAEALMSDTVTISYIDPDNPTAQDPDTGSDVPNYIPRFTSKCKVQTRELVAREEEAGGRTATTVRVELHLPVDAPDVETGDVAEITAVGALSDMQLLGRRFRVVAPVAKSFATARRLEVEEVVT